MKKTKLKIIVKMRKIDNFKYNYDGDYNEDECEQSISTSLLYIIYYNRQNPICITTVKSNSSCCNNINC